MAQATETLASAPAPVKIRTHRQRVWHTFKRNRPALIGLLMVGLLVFTAIFADDWFIAWTQGRDPQPLLAPYDPLKQDPRNRLQPPSWEHPLGLDTFGRDNLSRVIYGTRGRGSTKPVIWARAPPQPPSRL